MWNLDISVANSHGLKSGLLNFLLVLRCQSLLEGLKGRRCGGLMVSALAPGLSSLGSSPGQGHCVVFLGKALYSHSVSLHQGI